MEFLAFIGALFIFIVGLLVIGWSLGMVEITKTDAE